MFTCTYSIWPFINRFVGPEHHMSANNRPDPNSERINRFLEKLERHKECVNKVVPWAVPAAFTTSLAAGLAYCCVSFPSLTIQIICGAACPVALLVTLGLLAYCTILENTITEGRNTFEYVAGMRTNEEDAPLFTSSAPSSPALSTADSDCTLVSDTE